MKINTLHTVDFSQLSIQLSQHAGMAKLLVGAPDVAAMHELRQAIYDLKQSALYRGKAKQLVKFLEAEMVMWRTNLRYKLDDDITLFDVKDFEDAFRNKYKANITNDDYFALWEGVGGELYARTMPIIKSVRFKFKRHFEAVGCQCPDVLAEVCMASNLLRIAVESFECVTKNSMNVLPQTKPKFNYLVRKLNVQPVLARMDKLIDEVAKGDKGLNDVEAHEMRIAISCITDKWSDQEYIHEIQIAMMEEYHEDVFDETEYKKELRHQRKLHKDLKEQLIEERRQQIGAQVKDRRVAN